jgi:hypothetical protein
MLERVHTEVEVGTCINLWSGALHYALANTMKEAPIRRLLVDTYCLVGRGDLLCSGRQMRTSPKTFLSRLSEDWSSDTFTSRRSWV